MVKKAVATMVLAVTALTGAATAAADNHRLNDSVAVNVYTVQHHAGCTSELRVDPALQLAAQWQAVDMLNNRALDADLGSDGSTTQDRARAAGFHGRVAQTVAINPAMAITGVEIMRQWFNDPADLAIMSNCANTAIGVWSENALDRTVVVAVYGQPA
ncbi:CAP domain-containing protein [Mycobacterium sp. SMC-18]|uniref:CAP domain-containing protein n=1 Tax=unclassified Mycobacterium TaxID=2642494 RepID=UPI003877422F